MQALFYSLHHSLIAQLPTAAPGQIEGWLIPFFALMAGLVMLLTIAEKIRALFSRSKPPGFYELDARISTLEKHLTDSSKDTEGRLRALESQSQLMLVQLGGISARLDRLIERKMEEYSSAH